MDVNELYERGLKLRRQLFGNKAAEERMNALGEFGDCGIPAANEAHRIAYETVEERPARKA